MPLFEKARQRAGLLHFFSSIIGKPRHLLALDPAHLPLTVADDGPVPAQVPIRRIKGSVNRSRDFDCDFYPLNDAVKERWVRIASMLMQGASIPPIDLLEVDAVYYVIDGHHRLSVCQMLGQTYIDAVVRSRL